MRSILARLLGRRNVAPRIVDALPTPQPHGPAMVLVGTEGGLSGLEAQVAVRSLQSLDRDALQLWVVQGWEEDTRPPEAIPELRAYLLQLWGAARLVVPESRLHPATRELLTRCGFTAWARPAEPVPPGRFLPWRLSDTLDHGMRWSLRPDERRETAPPRA